MPNLVAGKNENQAELSTKDLTPSPTPPGGFPDFRNFKYPGYCFDVDRHPFTLTDGEFKEKKKSGMWIKFRNSYFADVTRDGDPDAMVVLSIITGGSAAPNCVYIFSKGKGDHPKLIELWAVETGDRADGGLRKIYDENGDLVIERYLSEGKLGDCCPQYYMKETYRWERDRFNKVSEEKVSNPVSGTE